MFKERLKPNTSPVFYFIEEVSFSKKPPTNALVKLGVSSDYPLVLQNIGCAAAVLYREDFSTYYTVLYAHPDSFLRSQRSHTPLFKISIIVVSLHKNLYLLLLIIRLVAQIPHISSRTDSLHLNGPKLLDLTARYGTRSLLQWY